MNNKPAFEITIPEVKKALLNPDVIQQLYDMDVDNIWGDVKGKKLLLDMYRICERCEELETILKEQGKTKP